MSRTKKPGSWSEQIQQLRETCPEAFPPQDEVYHSSLLPNGDKAEVIVGYGRHFMEAYRKSEGLRGMMGWCLFEEMVKINGERVSQEYWEGMPIKELSKLFASVVDQLHDWWVDHIEFGV